MLCEHKHLKRSCEICDERRRVDEIRDDFERRMRSRLEEIDEGKARIAALESQLAAAIARAEEAERVAVWAVKHHASLYHDEPVKHINYWTDERQRGQGESECDGTDADILRAVAEAMEETESDGK